MAFELRNTSALLEKLDHFLFFKGDEWIHYGFTSIGCFEKYLCEQHQMRYREFLTPYQERVIDDKMNLFVEMNAGRKIVIPEPKYDDKEFVKKELKRYFEFRNLEFRRESSYNDICSMFESHLEERFQDYDLDFTEEMRSFVENEICDYLETVEEFEAPSPEQIGFFTDQVIMEIEFFLETNQYFPNDSIESIIDDFQYFFSNNRCWNVNRRYLFDGYQYDMLFKIVERHTKSTEKAEKKIRKELEDIRKLRDEKMMVFAARKAAQEEKKEPEATKLMKGRNTSSVEVFKSFMSFFIVSK